MYVHTGTIARRVSWQSSTAVVALVRKRMSCAKIIHAIRILLSRSLQSTKPNEKKWKSRWVKKMVGFGEYGPYNQPNQTIFWKEFYYKYVVLWFPALSAKLGDSHWVSSHDTSPPLSLIMVAPEANAQCAAGDRCTHPASSGIAQLTGENYSPHKCLECNKPIHCAIFCGKSVYELKGNFDSSLLSINGWHIFTTTSDKNGMTVCHTCLFRLLDQQRCQRCQHCQLIIRRCSQVYGYWKGEVIVREAKSLMELLGHRVILQHEIVGNVHFIPSRFRLLSTCKRLEVHVFSWADPPCRHPSPCYHIYLRMIVWYNLDLRMIAWPKQLASVIFLRGTRCCHFLTLSVPDAKQFASVSARIGGGPCNKWDESIVGFTTVSPSSRPNNTKLSLGDGFGISQTGLAFGRSQTQLPN